MSNLLESEMYKRRKARKLSQGKLAEAANVSRNCIQQMECHEHMPLLPTLLKLTRVLEFSDEEYADFMIRLRDAYETDEAIQKEFEENVI